MSFGRENWADTAWKPPIDVNERYGILIQSTQSFGIRAFFVVKELMSNIGKVNFRHLLSK
ncbi:hypothetical protein J25TS5_07970 [Paenibacillus faecis]|nr:hypothetical protein J25TS5_07970 [Paenibacillus faecis]